MKKNIALFASGNGSNVENIIRYFTAHSSIRVALVLSNREQAFALERARRLGVECAWLPKEAWSDGTQVLELLRTHEIDFVALAGFLSRVPAVLLHAYPQRMVNLHPSLLPKFGGKGMYGDRVHRAVLEAGEAESGITIHYTGEHYDEGAVIFQATCPVCPEDTPDALATRIHALEYEHYPRVIEKLCCV